MTIGRRAGNGQVQSAAGRRVWRVCWGQHSAARLQAAWRHISGRPEALCDTWLTSCQDQRLQGWDVPFQGQHTGLGAARAKGREQAAAPAGQQAGGTHSCRPRAGAGARGRPCGGSMLTFCPTCANLLLGAWLHNCACASAGAVLMQCCQRSGAGRRRLPLLLPDLPLHLRHPPQGRPCAPCAWRCLALHRVPACCAVQVRKAVPLQRKEIEDIFGGEDAWASLPKTTGEPQRSQRPCAASTLRRCTDAGPVCAPQSPAPDAAITRRPLWRSRRALRTSQPRCSIAAPSAPTSGRRTTEAVQRAACGGRMMPSCQRLNDAALSLVHSRQALHVLPAGLQGAAPHPSALQQCKLA